MTAERWNQVVDMFSAVADRSPDQQQAHLDEACADDPDLRARVEELLINHEMAETAEFLKEPPWVIDTIPVMLPDFDEYTQIEYIGHGGMGVVYKAFDEDLDTHVALKMCLPRQLTTAEDIKRFRIDPQSMAKLKHPSIVHVHKVGEWNGTPFFTMNLIERKDGSVSMEKRLAGFMNDPAAAARLMIKVARAVHHAHQRGILHRDLKPGNILLDDEDNPRLTDFGLARQIGKDGTLTETGVPLNTTSLVYSGIVGTASYMSPEQADPSSGPEVTTLSDVYGLGATLYSMLTGRPPFQAESPLETLQLVRDPDRKPASVRQTNRSVDRDLEAACVKCLKKNPDDRYRSAEGLAKDLERWLAGKEGPRPWPSWYRLWRWCRRNPVTIIFTFVVFLLAGFGGKVWLDKRTVEIQRTVEQDAMDKETLRSTQYVAGLVASILHNRLEDLKLGVNEAAESDELKKLLEPYDQIGLDQFLRRLVESRIDPEGQYSFETAAYYDSSGKMLAHSFEYNKPERAKVVGTSFAFRDYFKGAMRRAEETGRAPVYVSKLYHSLSQGYYKIGIAKAIRLEANPGTIIGVIYASITTSRTMGIPRLNDQRYNPVLVGRGDPVPIKGETAPPQHVIVLHPSYPEHLSRDPNRTPAVPVAFSEDQVKVLEGGQFSDYRDPVGTRDPTYLGRWLAGSASVEGTDFVVIVQVRYDEAFPKDERKSRSQ